MIYFDRNISQQRGTDVGIIFDFAVTLAVPGKQDIAGTVHDAGRGVMKSSRYS